MIDIKKNGGFYYIKENHGTSLISEETYLAIHAQNQQLQQYKSIVKAVDPDNLPMSLDEVLAFSEGAIMLGCLFLHPCGDGSVECQLDGEILHNITHYIETKDVIKMMGDL